MEISPTYIQYKSYSTQPSFGSIATGLGKSVPNLRTNFTHFDRLGYDMNNLMDNVIRLSQQYKTPINITICGCSDGTKAIELQMAAIKRFRERGINFDLLPKINAFDIDGDMIKIAKNGRINISDFEYEKLQKLYPASLYPFWGEKAELIDIPGNDIEFIEKALNTKYRYSYQYNPKLLEKINIYQGDLFEEIPKLQSDIPQIVSFENIAIHLENDTQWEKASDLISQSLCPESDVIVGIRDKHYTQGASGTLPNNFVRRLLLNGFANDRNISAHGCVLEKLHIDPKTGFYYRHRI